MPCPEYESSPLLLSPAAESPLPPTSGADHVGKPQHQTRGRPGRGGNVAAPTPSTLPRLGTASARRGTRSAGGSPLWSLPLFADTRLFGTVSDTVQPGAGVGCGAGTAGLLASPRHRHRGLHLPSRGEGVGARTSEMSTLLAPRCPKRALQGQHCARVSSTLRLRLPGSSHSKGAS